MWSSSIWYLTPTLWCLLRKENAWGVLTQHQASPLLAWTGTQNTPIPHQPEQFWESQENKRNLQLLVRDIVCSRAYTAMIPSSPALLFLMMTHFQQQWLVMKISDLLNWIEEADARLVVHVDWAVLVQRCKRVVVVSNDTDTFALLLHYTPYFQDLWSEEIWQQNGTGEKRRKLPLHQAVSKLGASLVKAVIKVHILIGDDCMGKLGSKHAAVACDPVQ